MNQEVTRRHYLDAMGITAWAAIYQLPNAQPTQACEWEEAAPAQAPPRERLQALLDDAPSPRRQTSQPQASEPQGENESIASPAAVRALLGQEKPPQGNSEQHKADQNKPTMGSQKAATASVEPAKPLKFELSCVCLEGRWLLLKAGAMSGLEQQLLANVLQAAGIAQGALPEATHFTWPQMANAFAVEDPLDEAREGLAAFIAGSASRQGWQLERLLWWGEPDTQSVNEQAPLGRILDVTDGQSQTLSLPLWQGPALASLLEDSHSKRDLWPALQALAQLWETDKASRAELKGDQQATNDH